MQLTQTLHRLVQQAPAHELTVFGNRRRTAAQSRNRISTLAGGIHSLGLRPDGRVAILSQNSDRYHETMLAVPWADGIILPLNIRWSVQELAHSLRETEAHILIADAAFAETADTLRSEVSSVEHVIYSGDDQCPAGFIDYEQLLDNAPPVDDARRGGNSIYGIFYTGGTTGRAKGAMISHDNLMTSALGTCAGGSVAVRFGRQLLIAPMFHIAGTAYWLIGMVCGATQVVRPGFEAGDALATIGTERVTDMVVVPTMLQFMVDHPELPAFDRSHVRHILYGASPMPRIVLERAEKAFPSAQFIHLYGMTEVAPVATLLRPEDSAPPGSCGRAAPHCEIRVVDQHDNDVAPGEVGEILVRGDNVLQGYWRRPEESDQALRGGWMHTGDGGYLNSDGYLFVVDRIKDMIISGGENVYSVEIEDLLSTHPKIACCAVIGVPDEKWGERVHAVVVPRGTKPSPSELQDFCRGRLANFKIPRSFSFTAELPLSAAGKVLKRELRTLLPPTATQFLTW